MNHLYLVRVLVIHINYIIGLTYILVLFLLQLLTCINPNIQFKQVTPEGGERKLNGIAVALNPFINILDQCGIDTPGVEQIKNNINIHGIGVTKKAKQVFNATANGTTVSRCKDVSKDMTKFKTCVFIKKTAFSSDAWESFADCKYIIYIRAKKFK